MPVYFDDPVAVWAVCAPSGEPLVFLVGHYSEVVPEARLVEGYFDEGCYGELVPLTVKEAMAIRKVARMLRGIGDGTLARLRCGVEGGDGKKPRPSHREQAVGFR